MSNTNHACLTRNSSHHRRARITLPVILLSNKTRKAVSQWVNLVILLLLIMRRLNRLPNSPKEFKVERTKNHPDLAISDRFSIIQNNGSAFSIYTRRRDYVRWLSTLHQSTLPWCNPYWLDLDVLIVSGLMLYGETGQLTRGKSSYLNPMSYKWSLLFK